MLSVQRLFSVPKLAVITLVKADEMILNATEFMHQTVTDQNDSEKKTVVNGFEATTSHEGTGLTSREVSVTRNRKGY